MPSREVIFSGSGVVGFFQGRRRQGAALREKQESEAALQAQVAQGVQILSVHDVPETRAALDIWRAVTFAAL